uniref:Amine oxidase domain-containing protein n=1 Tax=Chromera velia CCMP2878 TaxID=1169474 RepID=A0A0G4HDM6_9ALVE|eukprot:Cvel_26338.t1-p1 / transcript=Cvel_26338.t1 / gene=Cvel_26338 / organism=Chromera_velia_CCMP2878 / gene_product=hypothetical protein / transcript_product=hypothetical protein / location=Cvel_scaffold3117:3314-6617(-) / protein_length=624 / sequence_SO=supercontig / SO=protein_coding / is_pseudo=false
MRNGEDPPDLSAVSSLSAPPSTDLPAAVDVIVVGGGVAGLTAAVKLMEGDPTLSVLVLEADSTRLGGRIYTEVIRGVFEKPYCFEHGAGWVHGVDGGNPMLAYFPPDVNVSQSLKAAALQNPWMRPDLLTRGELLLVDPVEERVLSPKETARAQELWGSVIEAYRGYSAAVDSGKPCGWKDARTFLGDWLSENLKEETAPSSSLLRRTLLLFGHMIEAYHGIPLARMGADSVHAFEDASDDSLAGSFQGAHSVVVCETGMSTLIRGVRERAEGLHKQRAQKADVKPLFGLGRMVKRIERDGSGGSGKQEDRGVTVTVNSGEVVRCHRVVCAVSSAAVQNIDVSPEFSEGKRESLQTFETVHYKKVALGFGNTSSSSSYFAFPPVESAFVGVLPSDASLGSAGAGTGDRKRGEEKEGGFEGHVCEWRDRNVSSSSCEGHTDGKSKEAGAVSLPAMLFENHQHTKGVPVLSLSLVGKFADAFTGSDHEKKAKSFAKSACAVIWRALRKHHLQSVSSFPSGEDDGRRRTEEKSQEMAPEVVWDRVTFWKETPEFGTSYGYGFLERPGGGEAGAEERAKRMSASHGDWMFFAGEAFELNFCGAVHAAIISAEHAAQNCLESLAPLKES